MAAEGINLATAWVEIVPSTKGLGASLSQQLVGPVGAAGNAAGASMSKGLSGAKGMLGTLIGSVGKFTLGAAVGGAAAVAMGKGIQSALDGATTAAKDYGSQVVLIQRLTGASAKESSTWAAILSRYGVEGRAASVVIKSLSAEIAGGGKNLAQFGIATKTVSGENRSSTAVISDLAEAYKNADDKTAILAVGSKALGRGFSALLPVLAGGKQAIEDLAAAAEANGLIFSNADIQAVKDYSKALKDNEDSVKGTTVQVGLATLPWETFKTKTIGGLLSNLHKVSPEMTQFGVNAAQAAAPLATFGGEVLLGVAALKFLGITAAGAGAAVGGAALVIAPLVVGLGILTVAYNKAAPAAYDYAKAVREGREAAPTDWESFVSPISSVAYTWDMARDAAARFNDTGERTAQTVGYLRDPMFGLMFEAARLTGATNNAADATGDMADASEDAAAAAAALTAEWKAQTLAMSNGRNDHEQALENIIAVDDAEQALATARKTHDPAVIALAEMKLTDARNFGAQTADGLTRAEARAAVKRGELTKAAATEMLKNGELTGSIGMYIAKLLKIPKSAYTTIGVTVNGVSKLQNLIDTIHAAGIKTYGAGTVRFEANHAAGGYFSTPHVANIAENRPEYVIDPLNANGPALISAAARDAGMVASGGGGFTWTGSLYVDGRAELGALYAIARDAVAQGMSDAARSSRSLAFGG